MESRKFVVENEQQVSTKLIAKTRLKMPHKKINQFINVEFFVKCIPNASLSDFISSFQVLKYPSNDMHAIDIKGA